MDGRCPQIVSETGSLFGVCSLPAPEASAPTFALRWNHRRRSPPPRSPPREPRQGPWGRVLSTLLPPWRAQPHRRTLSRSSPGTPPCSPGPRPAPPGAPRPASPDPAPLSPAHPALLPRTPPLSPRRTPARSPGGPQPLLRWCCAHIQATGTLTTRLSQQRMRPAPVPTSAPTCSTKRWENTGSQPLSARVIPIQLQR